MAEQSEHEPEQEGPGLTVAVVAQRLGIAPSTLRTWDRRYGLGPTQHSAGAHRRYRPEDLARLEAMRRLVQQGVPPSEAARLADGQPSQPPARSPGGRVLSVPGAHDVVRGLSRAAMALDSDDIVSTVTAQLQEHGVVPTWEHVLLPVLVAAGARWEATGEGVEVEHLLSNGIALALAQHAPRAAPLDRPVLLACAPDDLHVLPLHAIGAALAEAGIASKLLGAAVPLDSLHAAVRRTGPSVLVLWSQRPETADLALLELPMSRPPTVVIVAGPGWPAELPDKVGRVDALGAACDLVSRALQGKPLPSVR